MSTSEESPSRRWDLLHFLLFLAFLALWTWKLLEPQPVPEELRKGLAGYDFVAAKMLHACGYAFLTILAATLPVGRRFLVGVLLLHGVGTEIGQTFVPNRTGRVFDVVIDWCGIALGLLIVSRMRRRRARRTASSASG
jgi:VanZ family protein